MESKPISLIKAQLLKLTPKKFTPVNIPGVGIVHVHGMPETTRAVFEATAENAENKKAIKRLLVCFTCREGESVDSPLIFSIEDIPAMGKMDSAVIDKLATEGMKRAGIGDVDLETLLGEPEPVLKPMNTGSLAGLSA